MATAFQFDAFQNNAFQIDNASSFVITPTGSIVFTGTNTFIRSRQFAVSGSIVFSGTVTVIHQKFYLPTGTVTFSGTAPMTFGTSGSYVINPTGSITFSGTALEIRSRVITPTGLLTFSGSSALIKNKIYLPTGAITFSGTAPLQFTSAGGGTATSKLTLTFAGKT
jgi:hypothetical protein